MYQTNIENQSSFKKTSKGILALALALGLGMPQPSFARGLADASGDLGRASGDLGRASSDLAISMGRFGITAIQLSADEAIAIGKPIGRAVVHVVNESGDMVVYSAELSGDLAGKAVDLAAQGLHNVEHIVIVTAKEAREIFRAARDAAYVCSKETIETLESIGINAATLARDVAVASAHAGKAVAEGAVDALKAADDALVLVVKTGAEITAVALDELSQGLEKGAQAIDKGARSMKKR